MSGPQSNENLLIAERARLKEVYQKRSVEVDSDVYAPWQPGEMLMLFERRRVASALLVKANRLPERGKKCLEVGFGKLGWLADLIAWGLSERDLFGIELDEKRASVASAGLPFANLVVGDASIMPWGDKHFDLIVLSTVLSSISSMQIRKLISREVDRVLATNGAILLYDIAVRNPRNKDVLPVGRGQIAELFPEHESVSRSLTLAPPIARYAARKSWALASVLSAFPMMRTHRLTLLTRS